MNLFNNADFMAWVVLPVLIFLARMIDVSLATLRHILVYKGMRRLVPALAFVEVVVWLLAITQVMQNLSNIACFLAWAGGFSAGTYAGMVIEERLALGYQLVRVIAPGGDPGLPHHLRSHAFVVTSLQASGGRGPVEVFLVVAQRKRLKSLLDLLKAMDPVPFYTIEDVRTVGTPVWANHAAPGHLAMEGDLKKK